MASSHQQTPRASRMHYYATDDSDHDDHVNDSQDDEEEEEDEGEEENDVVTDDRKDHENKVAWCGSGRVGCRMGRVVDPRAKWVQEWNRVFLLVCAAGLFVDPLFFYALSVSDTCMCLFVDGWLAVTVTALRCMTDALHVWNMWLQLKMAKRAFGVGSASELAADSNPRSTALRYLKAKKGFFFDLFVILPLPQVWILIFVETFLLNCYCQISHNFLF